jgi:mRNA interferase RelE/StbE
LKVEFKGSFLKDLKKLDDRNTRDKVRAIIETVEQAPNLNQMENLKKLKGGDHYYRVRLGDYRIGMIVEEDKVIFVRFLHRKDIYRYSP